MSVFSRSSFLVFSVAIAARGYAASSPPASPPTPVHHEAVMLDQFVTSASPFLRSQVEVAQSTTVLGGRSLLLKQRATLGETLAGETGISSTAFGPGAGRPIIRGLGGDRIRLLENSVGTIDASVMSPDHAVSVEPFLVERVEVVRGPATLLYGSSAVGGVVNVITHRIETEVPAERVRGGGEVRIGGAAREVARGGLLDVALSLETEHALVLHVDGFKRSTGDMRIPDFAESSRIRAAEAEHAAEHEESPPRPARERLPNSALVSEGGAGGLTLVGKAYHLGVSYSGFNSDYGVPGHAHEHDDETLGGPRVAEGVRINLRQRRVDAQGEWRNEGSPISALRFKLGHADYQHTEQEPDGTIGTVFTNRGHDARFEILHGDEKEWNGALGAQMTRSRLAVSGDEAFLPPSRTQSRALFVFEELAREPLTWQFGGRLERTESKTQDGRARRDDQLSGSAGVVWKLGEAHSLALSLAHTHRAPNPQELFAYGPHAGTEAFEIGNASLAAEKSLGLELSLRRRAGFVTGAVAVYSNRFNGYIFEQASGEFAVRAGDQWEFLSPAEAAAVDPNEGLPVYRYVQRDAQFWGVELETLWHLHESSGYQLDFKIAADLTRAQENRRNLPRIPAARSIIGIAWASGPWSAGVEGELVFDQPRVAPGEARTAGYNLFSAYAGWSAVARTVNYDVFVRGTNLADEEARPHTSFVKELAPLAGRGISAGVRFSF